MTLEEIKKYEGGFDSPTQDDLLEFINIPWKRFDSEFLNELKKLLLLPNGEAKSADELIANKEKIIKLMEKYDIERVSPRLLRYLLGGMVLDCWDYITGHYNLKQIFKFTMPPLNIKD